MTEMRTFWDEDREMRKLFKGHFYLSKDDTA